MPFFLMLLQSAATAIVVTVATKAASDIYDNLND